jgi:hypothetical protein
MADTSLKAISRRVKMELEARGHMTLPELTSCLILEHTSHGESFPEETLRRRIYDVVTVFDVIGYVQKTQKSLDWVGRLLRDEQSLRPQIEAVTRKLEHKFELLRHKVQLLFLYTSLITANKHFAKPETAITFPAIVLGSKMGSRVSITKRSNRQITIDCPKRPELFSPFDILTCKCFTDEDAERGRKALPEDELITRMLGW